MNNKDYWNERAEQRFLMGEKTADELLQTMKPVYKNCLANINKEIEAFYGRYAENNQLTIAEVNKRLDPKQLKSAKEEIKKYYDTVDKLARNKDGTVDVNLLHQYKNELRLQSAKAYMSRLEELKLNLKNITVNLGVEESKAYYRTLSKIYTDTYKKTSYDMDKFFGFSAGFEGLNYKKLNSAIHQQWLGMNFSDRIWNNKGKLLDQINTTFLQGVAQGQNPRKIAETMSKNMSTAYYNCERLCRTESAHIMGEATLQGYKDRGTEKYKFEATLDNRTSDICQSLNGQVFKLREAQEGVNYPPMHPNCRSTTVPYFEPDDIDKMFDEAQRVARDENGELYYVPESMSYKQWQETMNKKSTMSISQVIKNVNLDNASEDKTTVYSEKEFENYVKNNKTEVWYRGYSATSEEELKSQTESMLNGIARLSKDNKSASGKGLYFTKNKDDAKGYAKQRMNEGGRKFSNVIIATLKKTAKFATHDILNELYSQKSKEVAEMSEKIWDLSTEKEQNELKDKIIKLRNMDIGSYAKLKGYDAIEAGFGEYVVLNQKMLIYKK
nr:MAG TPA: minor capsid protein [Caudoviricetes sp.]